MKMPPLFPLIISMSAALLLTWGCGALQVREIPIQLEYVPAEGVPAPRSGVGTVAIGIFEDARGRRASGPVGERVLFNGNVDRYTLAKSLPATISDVIRAYYARRGVRLLSSRWNGRPEEIWNQKGDIVVAGRVRGLWFSARDSYAMARARSDLRIELVVGAPGAGTIITKNIQIEPMKRSHLHWETKDVEAWLSRSISEALERVLPDIERRLVG